MAKKDSHEDKMINLTRQMQHNNVELQSFLKDLDSWEKDIKVKEDKLKSADGSKEIKKVRSENMSHLHHPCKTHYILCAISCIK